MKKTLLYSLLVCLALVMTACDDPVILQKETNTSFDKPTLVGVIDGKSLYMVKVYYNNRDPHYIYFFKESGDISINYSVQQGKYTRQEIVVLLNGKAVSTNYLENTK